MLEKINHYSINSPCSIYDEEALTALELAGGTAAKLNEAIEQYNALETETGDKLKAQTDFINKMNSETMPAEVKAEVNRHIQNGDFDKAINTYIGDLEGRIDNLVGSYTEGSTTMDAEVIDGRYSFDGVNYESLGEAIRWQATKVYKRSATASAVFFNNTPVIEFKAGESMTLTVAGTSHIFFNGKRYAIDNFTVTAPSNYMKAGQELFRIYYNTETETVSSQWDGTSERDDVFIGLIFRDNYYFVNQMINLWNDFTTDEKPLYPRVWLDGTPELTKTDETYTLNIPTTYVFFNRQRITIDAQTIDVSRMSDGSLCYLLYNLMTKEITVTGSSGMMGKSIVPIAMLHRNGGVYFNSINDYSWDYRAKATLLMSTYSKVVKIDTVEKTFTFPRDTLVLYNNGFSIIGGDISVNAVVSYANVGSSAVCIYMNRHTAALTAQPYTYNPFKDEILICTFRTGSGVCDLTVPYTVNGKLFSIIPVNDANEIEVKPKEAIKPFVRGIAHRGLSSVAPENTKAAIVAAANAGFRYVEVDLRETNDGIIIGMHDESVDRTTNGTGNVAELSWSSITKLDAGSWYGDSFIGEKVLNIGDILCICRNYGLHPYLEIKNVTSYPYLSKQIQIYGMHKNITFISFNIDDLKTLAPLLPNARLGLLMDVFDESHLNELLALKTPNNEVFISSGENLNNEALNMCNSIGVPCERWTIDTETELYSIHKRITGVTSNTLNFETYAPNLNYITTLEEEEL